VFPVNASVLSAFGTLVTPVRIDLARSMVRPLAEFDQPGPRLDERTAMLNELREEGGRVLAAAGVAAEDIRFRYGVDARYIGQGNEITIWVGEGDEWPSTYAEVVEHFEADYRRIYGLTIPDVGVEAVTWRLSAFAPAAPVEPQYAVGTTIAAPHRSRPVRFSRGTAAVDTPVYRRNELGLHQVIEGPAIVEERETTAVIRPGWTARIVEDGSLIADRVVNHAGNKGDAR
jgi:N-methylhydantoinase A